MEKLKPCPFCGGKKLKEKFEPIIPEYHEYIFSITCVKCNAFIMRSMTNFDKSEQTIKRILKKQVETLWNTRNGENNEKL